MVCCADPCEDALAKQWIGLTGRGIAQTLRGQYDERAESEAGAGAAETVETAAGAAETAAEVVCSEFARGYVAPHGAGEAVERGIAEAGEPAGTAAGVAGDDEDALLRRYGPLP